MCKSRDLKESLKKQTKKSTDMFNLYTNSYQFIYNNLPIVCNYCEVMLFIFYFFVVFYYLNITVIDGGILERSIFDSLS